MAETSEHLSDAQLAVLASSGGDDAQVEHLAACEACRERVANTVRAIRALADPVEIVAPPAGLWERVEDSLRGEGVGGAPGRPGVRERQTGSSRRRPRPRRSSWAVAVAGVLAGALAGGTGVAVATHLRDAPQDEARITAVTVGTADLQPVTATAMHGHAVMQREPDDRLELRVDVSELPEDGYLEVWLRDEQASRLISLGDTRLPGHRRAGPRRSRPHALPGGGRLPGTLRRRPLPRR